MSNIVRDSIGRFSASKKAAEIAIKKRKDALKAVVRAKHKAAQRVVQKTERRIWVRIRPRRIDIASDALNLACAGLFVLAVGIGPMADKAAAYDRITESNTAAVRQIAAAIPEWQLRPLPLQEVKAHRPIKDTPPPRKPKPPAHKLGEVHK